MIRPLSRSLCFTSAAVALCVLAQAARAADRPTIECVPDDTVLVVHAPAAMEFVTALRERTKLGAVMLSPERLDRILGLVRDQGEDEWNEMVRTLGEYNLRLDDLPALLSGDMGAAVVMRPREEATTLVSGLLWAEPGEDLAQRIFAAAARYAEQHADEEGGPQRVDLQLVGNEVLQLTWPVSDIDVDFSKLEELPPDATDDQYEAWEKQRQEMIDKAPRVVVDQSHLLIARRGGRLLAAVNLGNGRDDIVRLRSEGRDVDLAEASGGEEMTRVFAQFLEAHEASEGTKWAARMLDTPGMRQALPSGNVAVELLGDPRPLVKLLEEMFASDPETEKIAGSLGLEALGPFGMRVSLDGSVMRTGVAVSMPSPRRGILALLDQPGAMPEPPPWVSKSVLSYTQINFDLGVAFKQVRELVMGVAAEEAGPMFEAIDSQLQSMLQTDPATLLSSIGSRHYSISFEPEPAKAEPEAEATQLGLVGPTGRGAVIWELQDEALWKRIMGLAASFAPLTEGMVKPAEEQGFNGLRIENEFFEGGLFVGQGYMLLGFGPQVVETVMTGLRNPPASDEAFRNSPIVARARELIPPQPCLVYQMGDYGSQLKTLRSTFVTLIDQVGNSPTFHLEGGEAVEDQAATEMLEDQKVLLEKIKQLIPSEEELEGAGGVTAGQARVTDEGLSFESAIELPPPR